MTYDEAIEWLSGSRSMVNLVPVGPFETWQIRIAEADAAQAQCAYWVVRAHKEGLVSARVEGAIGD